MCEKILYQMKVIGLSIVGLMFFALSPTYATLVTAWLMSWVIDRLAMTGLWSWAHWMIYSPLIYIAWLNSFLIGSAIDLRAWQFLFGYQKHRRISTTTSQRDNFQFHLLLLNYTRQKIVWNLPLTRVYQGFEGLRMLVLWAGSLRTHVGKRSLLFGFMHDPDLTEIGDGVVLGDGSTLTAHSITPHPDGGKVFVSAPIVIGPRSVIGGAARIDLGVRMGADAIVEPMSYVAPYTIIGPGEVWGGNPARFVRMRESPAASDERTNRPTSPALTDRPLIAPELETHESTLREIVALALDRPLDSITAGFSADQCASWDSLGQLGIAAGLEQRFGIVLSPQESFRLKSLDHLRKLIQTRMPMTTSVVQRRPPPEQRAA